MIDLVLLINLILAVFVMIDLELLINLTLNPCNRSAFVHLSASDFWNVDFYGSYEGRCGLPTNFDATYCYALGYAAGALLHSGRTGLIASVCYIRHLLCIIVQFNKFAYNILSLFLYSSASCSHPYFLRLATAPFHENSHPYFLKPGYSIS